jgi:DNA-directed RNA polymerase subunit alpha
MVEQDEKFNLSLDITGPATVTAKDIDVPALVTVLNPDHLIATVNEGGRLKIDFDTDNGVGYVAAEDNKGEEDPADRIAVDSLYSPVRRVNYRVDPARVGGRTDYDKLVIEVWTNGSLISEEAVGYCVAIFCEQFKVFIGDQEFKEEVVEEEPEEALPTLSEDLYRTVEELELSVRSSNCLKNANIRWIGELVMKTEEDLLQTKNFGRKSLKEIKEILSQLGFSLNMDLEGFDPENPPATK